jgi:cytochrome c-type biogenesis protein CcmH
MGAGPCDTTTCGKWRGEWLFSDHGKGALPVVIFWALAGFLCLVTLFILMQGFRSAVLSDGGRDVAALAVYKDQLVELDRDVAVGAISAVEAEGQRTEISRRLIAASKSIQADCPGATMIGTSKWFVLSVPLLAIALYWQIGNHTLADVPRADRMNAAQQVMDEIQAGKNVVPERIDMPAVIALVEKRVEEKPKEVTSWQFLASNYLNTGRFGDAAVALDRIIALEGPSAERYASLGEALVFENRGLMTATSVAAIREALKLDPKHPKARYYTALGLAQDGKREDARAAFTALLADSPANAPWRSAVESQIANLAPSAVAPEISDEQMQAGQDMAPEERMAMIRGMVDGLDAKLKANPQDVEGWLRVIRARTVLNENEKAVSALATARLTFAGKPDETKLIDALAQELNLK